jgi:hypothetical protein
VNAIDEELGKEFEALQRRVAERQNDKEKSAASFMQLFAALARAIQSPPPLQFDGAGNAPLPPVLRNVAEPKLGSFQFDPSSLRQQKIGGGR